MEQMEVLQTGDFIDFAGFTVADKKAREKINELVHETNLQNETIAEHEETINNMFNADAIKKMIYPSLSNDKKTLILQLARAYQTNKSNLFYDTLPNRNLYVDTNCFNADGKLVVNCSSFVQFVWGGISQNTFLNKQTIYDGSIEKSFDWGYYFKFPFRKAYGLTRTDGSLYQPTVNETGETLYSSNTYYSEDSDREDKQMFKSYMHACDMALELFLLGCEIPMQYAEVGDLIFFKSESLHDDIQDGFEQKAFRDIVHVGIISNINKQNNILHVLHCTNVFGQSYVISEGGMGNLSSGSDIAYGSNLLNRVCMIARHPHAFGYNGNVPNKFTAI